MDQRLNYRDIPWHVAIAVMPGKILGTIFIKWPNWIVDEWKQFLVGLGLIFAIFLLLWLGLYEISDGDINIFKLILQLFGVDI
jgi:hypothetical protein